MTTNASMTLYHRNDKTGKYTRFFIEKVMWQGGKGAGIDKGYENANDVTVRIPKQENDLINVVFDIGDIIVKGNVPNEITKKSDLQGFNDIYNITLIKDNDFGSPCMQHIHLGGK